MAEHYPARINLRLSQRTYDVYREAADLSGIEITALLRKVVDESVVLVAAMAEAVRALQDGQAQRSLDVMAAMAETARARIAVGEADIALIRKGVKDEKREVGSR